jgi:pimeloyl-ACP methyl ester carboxylesterase
MEYQRLYGFDNIRSYLQIDQSMHIGHEDEQMHGLFGDQSGPWMKVLQTMVSDMEALGTHRSFWQLPHVHRRRFWKMFSRFSAAAFSNPLLKRFAGLGRHEALVKNVAPVSNWPVYLDCIRTFVEHQVDFRQHMAQLPAGLPVWFFVGDRSEMYPAAGQLNVKKTIPHAQVVRFHKAGHAVMFDSPVRFIRHLDNFLDQTGPRRRARSTHKRASAVSSPLEA